MKDMTSEVGTKFWQILIDFGSTLIVIAAKIFT